MKKLVEAKNLEVKFKLPNNQFVHALNGVDIEINENETLGLIGESGSGKSTLGKTLLGLIKYSGNIDIFQNELKLDDKSLIRGIRKEIGVVFQEPFLSLNPRMKIKNILSEPLLIHSPDISKDEIREKINQSLKNVFLDIDYLETHLRTKIALISTRKNEGIDALKNLISNYKDISITPCINASEIDKDYFENLQKAFPNQLLYKLWLVITQDVNFGKTDRKEIDAVANFKTKSK